MNFTKYQHIGSYRKDYGVLVECVCLCGQKPAYLIEGDACEECGGDQLGPKCADCWRKWLENNLARSDFDEDFVEVEPTKDTITNGFDKSFTWKETIAFINAYRLGPCQQTELIPIRGVDYNCPCGGKKDYYANYYKPCSKFPDKSGFFCGECGQ